MTDTIDSTNLNRKRFYLDTSGVRKIGLWILTDCNDSQTEAAKKLGVGVSSVNQWLNMTKRIPLHHAYKIEELSEGRYKAAELRG